MREERTEEIRKRKRTEWFGKRKRDTETTETEEEEEEEEDRIIDCRPENDEEHYFSSDDRTTHKRTR